MKKFIYAIASLMLLSSAASMAEVRMPQIFGNGMVLQQLSRANIWGWADAGKKVTIKASWSENAKVTVVSDENGKWKASIPTPSAGGPYYIEISDGQKIALCNIMIGEVWICSGQSNMEMPVKGFTNQPVEGSMDAIMRSGAYSDRIRLYTVRKAAKSEPQDDCEGHWQKASFEATPDASAIAYFFAEYLTDALNVPVGVIMTDWGGSAIEAWMTEDVLRESLKGVENDEQFAKRLENRAKRDNHKCANLYNGMICPIIGYTAKGFLWYQGCTNLGDSNCYDRMQAAMVKLWRKNWGDDKDRMPFYYVAIAPHTYGDPQSFNRGYFVENQLNAAKITPNSDCAITETLGDETGIIHPAKKRQVSLQLANLALVRTYGIKSSIGSGYPQVREIKQETDGTYAISFNNVNGGFNLFLKPNVIKGFEVASEDKVFHKVDAWNDGKVIRTFPCADVPAPVAVRYSFRNCPSSNLTDAFGTPVPPFRSDNWAK